jgi:serine protease Do
MHQLKENGKINRGRLDVSIQEITSELSEALSLQQDYGVLVVDVRLNGVGDKAGLKRGDLIVEFNNQQVLNSRKLELFVADSHIGEKVKLKIIRSNEPILLTAEILEFKKTKEKIAIDEGTRLQKSDIMFGNLLPKLRAKFGVGEEGKGIMVVEPVSKELNLDLKIGDLIMAINDQYIENIDQFNNIYEKIKEEKKRSTVLLVKRKNFTMFVVLPIT